MNYTFYVVKINIATTTASKPTAGVILIHLGVCIVGTYITDKYT